MFNHRYAIVVVAAITFCSILSAAADESIAANAKDELTFNDLSHASKSGPLTVTRTYSPGSVATSSFGPGWGDENVYRLTVIDPDAVLIWRGGKGWRLVNNVDGQWRTDSNDKMTSSVDGWALELSSGQRYSFDGNGRLQVITDPGSGLLAFRYDEHGRLVQVGDQASGLNYQYDARDSHVTKVSGPEGLVAEYSYDSAGRLESVTNAFKRKTSYKYSADGQLAGYADEFGDHSYPPVAGSDASFTQDATGFANLAALDPTESEMKRTEENVVSTDDFGRPVELRNASGKSKKIRYNEFDLPVEISHYSGIVETLTYDDHGRLVKSEASNGSWAEFGYDNQDRLVIVRKSPGVETTLSYDDKRRVVSKRTSSGESINTSYDDSQNRITQLSSATGQRVETFDKSGNLVGELTAGGLAKSYVIDAKGRVVSYSDPLHGKTDVQYDADGRTRTMSHPQAGKWSYEETPFGQVLKAVSPGGKTTLFSYTPEGNPSSVITADGAAYRYQYNGNGRLREIASPAGVRTSIQYNSSGLPETITRGSVFWRQFQYDDAGRITQVRTPAGNGAQWHHENGKVARCDLPDGSYKWDYKNNGQEVTVTGPGYSFTETYYEDGSLSGRICKESGISVAFPRDVAGRQAGVEFAGLKASYHYDNAGRVARIDLPGGGAIDVTHDAADRVTQVAMGGAAKSTFTYDYADRVTEIRIGTGGGKTASETYTYDAEGNRAASSTPAGNQQYSYDLAGRLIQSSVNNEKLAYDVDGNLKVRTSDDMSIEWVLDPEGRPKSGSVSFHDGRTQVANYTWDPSGNLTRIDSGTVSTPLRFDALDRLVSTGSSKAETTYGYYPSGDRLWKKTSAGTTWYEYSEKSLLGVRNPDGTAWMLVTLPGTDFPVALCSSKGETYFVAADAMGSTRALVDSNGKAVAQRDFSPYGSIVNTAGECPVVLFAGMLHDGGSRYYARKRYYDSALARFLSIDPELGVFQNPATHNAYAYAGSNPFKYRDPKGASLGAILRSPFSAFLTATEKAVYDGTLGQAYRMAQYAQYDDKAKAAFEFHKMVLNRFLERGKARALAQGVQVATSQGAGVLAAQGAATSAAGAAAAETAAIGAGVAEGAAAAVGTEAAATGVATTVGAEAAASGVAAGEVASTAIAGTGTTAGAGTAAGIGMGMTVAGNVVLAGIAGYSTYHGVKAAQATFEAKSAEANADAVAKAIEKKIQDLANQNPNALAPALGGKTPDPYNPDDMSKILGKLHDNLKDPTKKPLDGMINEAELIGEQLAKARKHYRLAVENAQGAKADLAAVSATEEEASTKVSNALKLAGITTYEQLPLAGLGDVAANAEKLVSEASANVAAWQTARAELDAAIRTAGDVAQEVCGLTVSDSASQQEKQQMQTEARGKIAAAKGAIDAASAKLAGADNLVSQLEAAVSGLRSFSEAHANATGSLGGTAQLTGLNEIIKSAEASIARANTLRESATSKFAKSREEAASAQATLAQYAHVHEASLVLALVAPLAAATNAVPSAWDSSFTSAFGLGATIGRSLPQIVAAASAAVALYKSRLDAKQKESEAIKLPALIVQVESALASVRPVKATADSSGVDALARATECADKILAGASTSDDSSKADSTSTDDTAATPTPGTGDTNKKTVLVPDLSVFSNVSEMIAALRHNDLKPAIKASKIKTPSKEQEFKLQAQSPRANQEVFAGATVSVYVYQRFGGVPDLTGMTLSEAQSTLEGHGLRVGGVDIITVAPTEDVIGHVYFQTPAAGSEMPADKAVSIKIYKAPPRPDEPEVVTATPSADPKDDVRNTSITNGGKPGEMFGSYSGQLNVQALPGVKPYSFNGSIIIDAIDGHLVAYFTSHHKVSKGNFAYKSHLSGNHLVSQQTITEEGRQTVTNVADVIMHGDKLSGSLKLYYDGKLSSHYEFKDLQKGSRPTTMSIDQFMKAFGDKK